MDYRQYQMAGFEGINNGLPGPVKSPNAFEDVLNFLAWKGRLRSRPKFINFGAPADGAIVRDMRTFEDAVGQFHTLVLTTRNAYHLTSGPTYTLLAAEGTLAGTSLPYGVVQTYNRVYFGNGSIYVAYADGSSAIHNAGDVQGGARYMTAIANRILLAHTTEPALGNAGAQEYPNRIRWCVNGNTDDWTGFGSGFADIVDIPHRISGLNTISRNAYLWTKSGVSLVYQTGDGLTPLAVEHHSISPRGIGNAYPYSLATYGTLCGFVAFNDVYTFNGVDFKAIGGSAKKQIFKDLLNANPAEVTGHMEGTFGPGMDMFAYWLSIPSVNVTWVYLFDEGTWQRIVSNNGRLTFVGCVRVE